VKAPIEYGDNFPVVPSAESWDPTVPWRFPQHEIRLKPISWLQRALPWLMLLVGMGVGILWMSWHAPISMVGKSMDSAIGETGRNTSEVILQGQAQSAHVVGFRGDVPRHLPKRQRTGLA